MNALFKTKKNMFKILKKLSVILIIILLTNNIKAQSKIDSLKSKLNYSTTNTKIDLYYKLSLSYIEISADSALKFATNGLALIDANHGLYKKYDFYDIMGSCNVGLYKYKIALQYFQQALEGYENENNLPKQIKVINSIGVLYGKTSYYDKALSYFQQALSKSNELKDTTQICIAITNIGLVYQVLQEYKLALENFEKVYTFSEKLNLKVFIAHALNDIAHIYLEMKEYSKALEYQLKSLEVTKQINNRRNIAVSTYGLGNIYIKLKKYDKALEYLFDAYSISKDFEDKFLNSDILCNIASTYLLKKNYILAKQYLDNSLLLANDAQSRETLRDIYELYSTYYSEVNNPSKALEYYKRFKETNDSIFSTESRDKITELQIKFEIQEKDKENEILRQKTEIQKLDIQKQVYLRNTFLYIAIIFVLLVIFIFYRYGMKQRANKMLTSKNEFINKQKNELEEVYKTKDKLFAVITHDLKNPFNTIVTLSSFLESNYYSLEDNHKFKGIQSIKRSIANVYELLENLTDWLNSKGNTIKLSKTNFDISSTINSVIKIYKLQAEQKFIDLHVNIESNIFVFADERMTKTVLRNLLDNAIKFTPVQGSIEININEKEDKLIVGVSDSGVGISEEDKPKLFNLESTFTTEGTQYEVGGGLGLILSKEFVEKNEGEIWFESELGKGSTFYFSIIKGVQNEQN